MSCNSLDDEGRVVPDDLSLLTQLTEYTNDVLWMFTPDWQELAFVNSSYENLFGQSVASLREDPSSFLEAVHPDDQQKVTDAMERLSGGDSVNLEYRVNPEKDYQTWVWVQGHPIYDESSDIEYVAGYSRDITKRKQYQQKLEQQSADLERSNESLRDFAYIASHDLQEPLRMVSSYVDLLDQEYGDQFDGEAQEYMEFAVNGAQRMQRMIDSLLEYSRVHTQADEFRKTDVDDVFDDTLQDLQLLIDDHNAEISADDFPTLRTDRNQLRQVFQNLVKNAIEHADEGDVPKIEVTATERDEAYEFAVSDNGPGIPPDQQDEVFKIFEQGTAASDADNTGIGLAISQRIVQRHGGTIWVESESDIGATFKFTIPKAAYLPEQESTQL